ncbi:hypothetical protein [Stackebrandtia soli]|uniref:hypothetical protein n=1 Tax=Stackebrandtia soli TaxID=1892856 RepID=UPI0039EA7C4C
MSRAAYREVLQAIYTGDFNRADQLSDALGDVAWRDSGMLVAAVFSLAVKGRFTADSSPEAIRDFVTDATTAVSDPDGTMGAVINGVVRAALGEEHLLDTIPPGTGMRVQLTLTRKIFADADASADSIAGILDQAERLLDEAEPDAA